MQGQWYPGTETTPVESQLLKLDGGLILVGWHIISIHFGTMTIPHEIYWVRAWYGKLTSTRKPLWYSEIETAEEEKELPNSTGRRRFGRIALLFFSHSCHSHSFSVSGREKIKKRTQHYFHLHSRSCSRSGAGASGRINRFISYRTDPGGTRYGRDQSDIKIELASHLQIFESSSCHT